METMTDAQRLTRLQIPTGRISMVLDTDTYNEIDDQFAILYALQSDDRIDLQAIYAALFQNARAATHAEGMEKSYQEILKIMKMVGKESEGFAFRGCTDPLRDAHTPQPGDAVEDLIRRARTQPIDDPLFVVGIGACTNIASALLKAPDIKEKIVAVWLVGNTYDWPDPGEFNLSGDKIAAAVLFDSGVPLIQVPASGVTGFLISSVPELEACIGGKNAVCDYLVENVRQYQAEHFAWGKAIWDVGTVGLLVNPAWAAFKTVPAPIFTERGLYAFYPERPLIRCVTTLDRDAIFRDMFQKLAQY